MRTLLQIACFAWALVTSQFLSAQDFAGGDGTEDDPYQIETIDQLNKLRVSPYVGGTTSHPYFILKNDITLTDAWYSTQSTDIQSNGWLPIPAVGGVFYGHFDGGGNTISGVWVNRGSAGNIGFFSRIESGASIKNLNLVLDDKGIIGSQNVGGLVGVAKTGANAIANCSVTGNVTAIKNTESCEVGGLLGISNAGTLTVTDCSYSGNVRGYANNVGGLIGSASVNLTLTGCSVSGTVIGKNAAETANTLCVGGFVGYSDGSVTINVDDCHATVNVTGGRIIGGFVGRIFAATTIYNINNSSVTGNITAETTGNENSLVGGFVGLSVAPVTFQNDHYSGTVHAKKAANDGTNAYAGGLIGRADHACTIEGCSATGLITSLKVNETAYADHVGGFVGGHESATTLLKITNSFAAIDVKGQSQVGGFVGTSANTTIQKSYVSGTITGSSKNVGGFVGAIISATSNNEITQSYATGKVSGSINIGGFVGALNSNSTLAISESYVTNEVDNAGAATGGFIGKSEDAGAITFINSVAANSAILGNNQIGTLIGLPKNAANSTTVTNTIAYKKITFSEGIQPNENTTNQIFNAPEAPLTTILDHATYSAWDFTGTWAWGTGNYKLPLLQDLTGQPTEQPAHLVLSTDAALSALAVSVGTLDPSFVSTTTEYTVNLPYNITSVTLTATANDANASLVGDGEKTGLTVGDNNFNIVVTAEDATVTKTYTVKVVRAAPATDAALSALTVSTGTLDPVFDPATTAYTVDVAYNITSITLTATAGDANASLVGAGTKTGLTVGDNDFSIVVTAEDGTTTETYTIKVVRAAPATDAALSALTVSAGTLDPVFDPATTTYSVEVANTVTSITITATASDANASLVGAGTKTGLTVGDNVFNIVVTAEDGTTTETYTVTVNRLQLVSIKDVQSGVHYQVVNHSIEITGAEGIITLTNINGLSKKMASKGNVTSVPVSAAGVYVLTINNVSYKVIIK